MRLKCGIPSGIKSWIKFHQVALAVFSSTTRFYCPALWFIFRFDAKKSGIYLQAWIFVIKWDLVAKRPQNMCCEMHIFSLSSKNILVAQWVSEWLQLYSQEPIVYLRAVSWTQFSWLFWQWHMSNHKFLLVIMASSCQLWQCHNPSLTALMTLLYKQSNCTR